VPVDTLMYDHRVYPPDCIVWATAREHRGPIFAACGDRRETGVMAHGTHWVLDDDGIVLPQGEAIDGGRPGQVAAQTELKPIDAVLAAAMRQPTRHFWSAPAPVAHDDEVVPAIQPAWRPCARVDQNSRTAHLQLVQKARSGVIDAYFVGDSITRRWGALDYPKLLAHWTASFSGWNAADFGCGGDKIENVLWRLQNGEIEGITPKVIVLQAGTNNVGPKAGPDRKVADVTRGIGAIVGWLQRTRPNTPIVLTAIFPRNDNMAVVPEIVRINANLAHLADGRHVRFLNINERLADANGHLFAGMMNDDGLHPSLKGYQVWADALTPVLTEILGPRAAIDRAPAPTGDPSRVDGNR